MGDLRYLADTKIDAFTSPLARGQIAAALALLGDRGRAQTAFAAAVDLLPDDARRRARTAPITARACATAPGLLTLVSEADNARRRHSAGRQDHRRGARQPAHEHAGEGLDGSRRPGGRAQSRGDRADGRRHGRIGAPSTAPIADAALSATGPSPSPMPAATPVQAVVTVTGNPIEPEPAIARGYAVERSYYRLDGTPGAAPPGAAERPPRGGAESHRNGGEARRGCCWSTGCRLASRSTIRTSSTATRWRASPGSRGTSSRRTPSTATTGSSPPSTARRSSRRSSPSPTWSAPSRPARYVHPAGAGRGHVPPRAFRPHGLRLGRGRAGAIAMAGFGKRRWLRAGNRRSRRSSSVPLLMPRRWRCGASSRASGRSTSRSRRTARPSCSTGDGRLLRPFATPDGRWRLPVETADVDPRYLAMLKAYEDARFDSAFRASTSWRSCGPPAQYRRQRPHRVRRFDADHAGGAPAGAARRTHAFREVPPDGAGRATGATLLEGRDPAPLSHARALRRQPRGLARGEPVLFRARAEAPVLREAALARRPAAVARDAPSRSLRCTRRGRARPRARPGAGTAASSPRRRPKATKAERRSRRCARAFPMLAAHAAEAAVSGSARPGHTRLTIDARLQATSRATGARSASAGFDPRLSAAILVIDNATGEVRAQVGSPDYHGPRARRRHRHDACALRSPGSALKPFIYALAFESGLAHPETLLDDQPVPLRSLSAREFRSRLPGHGHGAQGAAAVAQRAGRGTVERARPRSPAGAAASRQGSPSRCRRRRRPASPSASAASASRSPI